MYVVIPIQATYTVQDSNIVTSHYAYVHAAADVVAQHIAQALCGSAAKRDQGGDMDGCTAR